MARKRKTNKKTTYRRKSRSRMGAISTGLKDSLMATAYGVAGAIAASYVTNAVTKAVEKVDSLKEYAETIGAATPVVVGAFLPKLVKQKSPLMTGLQQGMLIGGGLSLVKSLKILPGVGAISPLVDFSVPKVGAIEDVRSYNVPMVGNMPIRQAAMCEAC
jgi:hypothetical protein